MLKMALFDCAINEKCCSVDGGWGIRGLFLSPPRGIWQLKSSHSWEFAIQGKKNASALGSAQGEGGGGWVQVELADALDPSQIEPPILSLYLVVPFFFFDPLLFFVLLFFFSLGPHSNQPQWTGHLWLKIVQYKINK